MPRSLPPANTKLPTEHTYRITPFFRTIPASSQSCPDFSHSATARAEIDGTAAEDHGPCPAQQQKPCRPRADDGMAAEDHGLCPEPWIRSGQPHGNGIAAFIARTPCPGRPDLRTHWTRNGDASRFTGRDPAGPTDRARCSGSVPRPHRQDRTRSADRPTRPLPSNRAEPAGLGWQPADPR